MANVEGGVSPVDDQEPDVHDESDSTMDRGEKLLESTFDAVLQDASKYPRMEQGVFNSVWQQWNETKNPELMERMVGSNLPLVVTITRKVLLKFRNSKRIAPEDLFQEGAIALTEAIMKFRPELGFKISTYATRAIQMAMYRYFLKNHTIIRIPERAITEAFDEIRVLAELEDKLDKGVSSGVKLSKTTEAAREAMQTSSLDESLKSKDKESDDHYKTVKDERQPSVEDQIIYKESENVLEPMLRDFDPLDRFLLINTELAEVFGKEKLKGKELYATAAKEFNLEKEPSKALISISIIRALKKLRERHRQYEDGEWKISDAPAENTAERGKRKGRGKGKKTLVAENGSVPENE